MNILKTLLVFAALTTSAPALAGFHMEPYLGLGLSGTWDNGARDNDASMTNYGIRLGYQAPVGLQVGGDIQLSTASYDALATNNSDLNGANAAFGVYLGYQSFLGIRGSVAYMVRSALALDDTVDSVLIGDAIKLSAGYRIIDWLAVNLEYHMFSYDEAETNLGNGSVDFSTDIIMVSVSFPFNFGG